MIRGLLLRTVALAAIAGQLQLLPAAIACAAEHSQSTASHCSGPIAGDEIALAASHDVPVSPLCILGVGCVAPVAGLQALAAAGYRTGDILTLPADAPHAPASLDLSPTPPPPQL